MYLLVTDMREMGQLGADVLFAGLQGENRSEKSAGDVPDRPGGWLIQASTRRLQPDNATLGVLHGTWLRIRIYTTLDAS